MVTDERLAELNVKFNEYNLAPRGEGPHTGWWKDKPHRVLWECADLLRDVSRELLQRRQAMRDLVATISRRWCATCHCLHDEPRPADEEDCADCNELRAALTRAREIDQ